MSHQLGDGSQRNGRRAAIDTVLSTVILALSVTLWSAKRQVADLERVVDAGFGSFIIGAPIPDLTLRLEGGTQVRLPDLCESPRLLVIVIWQNDCEACAAIADLREDLTEKRSDLQIVIIGTDGYPAFDRPDHAIVTGMALPSDIATGFGITEVPAVVRADDRCRIATGAIGSTASALLLKRLASRIAG